MKDDLAFSRETRSIACYKRMFDQVSRLAKIGAWECNLETEDLVWTDGVYDLFEIARGSPVDRMSILDLYDADSRRQMQRLRAEAIRHGGCFTLDARIRTGRGASRWMRLTAEVAYEHGRPSRLFGAKQDITLEKEQWDRLRQRAECDPLTGLANRGMFEATLRDMSKGGFDEVSALAFIDLDYFKQINDRLGHSAGDECLQEIAARLRRAFADAILVARIGGDEFAVLLRAPLGRLRIASMLARARRILSQPVFWNGSRIDIGASIGATILDRRYRLDRSRLFAEADSALYLAKAAGRNTVRIFGEEIEEWHRPRATGGVAARPLHYGR